MSGGARPAVRPPRRSSRPVLFVTNHVPPDRAGAFAALHERVPIELALFGGRSHHATGGVEDPGVPHRHLSQRGVLRLASSGRHRAVVCGTAGRIALPSAWRGARAAGLPFVLWSALWAHPRSPVHLAGALLLHRLYRDADAVVAYGPHVAAFARARGARRVGVAPQAVDNAWWAEPAQVRRPAPFTVAFVGRDAPEKGLAVLREAWRIAGLRAPDAALVVATGDRSPAGVRDVLGSADACVVPSLRTVAFREPWGLVANEAFNQGTPVIASDEVGAAAGGLVRHERNGLIVAAGDAAALAGALCRLRTDPRLRERLGANARRDVAAYTFEAWAAGFAGTLASLP